LRIVRTQGFVSTYIIGAVIPETGEAYALILPNSDTQATQEFLNELALHNPENRHLVLVLDNAPWHKAAKLDIPSNITLFFLLPYSPELNPIEQLWLIINHSWLSNRQLDSYDELIQACANAWYELKKLGSNFITNLCSREWAIMRS